MAKEHESQSTGQSINPSFSADDQLSAFRRELDEKTGKLDVIKIVPGYLFRDGKERRAKLTPAELRSMGKWGWGGIDEDLLKRHAETYREALEARGQLLERIKPVEILEMVRDIWGGGDLGRMEEGATLTYSFLMPGEERGPGSYHPVRWGGGPLNQMVVGGGYSSGSKTGKWIPYRAQIKEEIGIYFGNSKFPGPSEIYREEINQFFADHYYGSHSRSEFPYASLPKEIWRRPDNLGIRVTVPYTIQTRDEGWYLIDHTGIGFDEWFDQSSSQQEVMDYLAQKLEAQRNLGQLPSQIEEVEFAKIEELDKRGLFLKSGSREGKVMIRDYYGNLIY